MQFNEILFLVSVLVPSSLANLVCYHCDDCALRTAVIQPCGFDDGLESPVQTVPAIIETTTSYPWPTIVLTTAGGDDEGVVSRNPSDRPGSSTTTSGRPGSDKPNDNGEPLLTPPTAPGTIYPVRRGVAAVTPSIEQVKQRYRCLTMKSVENNREVIRRGCVQLSLQREDICKTDSVQQCEVCSSHLCNN